MYIDIRLDNVLCSVWEAPELPFPKEGMTREKLEWTTRVAVSFHSINTYLLSTYNIQAIVFDTVIER